MYDVGPLVRYLENRAYEAIDAWAKLERKQATAKRVPEHQTLASTSYAWPAEAKAIASADEVALLARWLRDDILSVAGPKYAIRRCLLDFVVAELRPASRLVRIGSGRKVLAGEQRDNLFGLRFGTGTVVAAWPKSGRSCVKTAGGLAGAIPADVGPEAVAS